MSDEHAQTEPAAESSKNSSAHLVAGDLAGLADTAEEIAKLLSQPAAPVTLPPPGQLEVRLVSEQALDRVFDAESDANLHANLFMLAFGAMLGFFTNVITASTFSWNRSVIVYLALLGLISLLLGLLAIRSFHRLGTLKKKIARK